MVAKKRIQALQSTEMDCVMAVLFGSERFLLNKRDANSQHSQLADLVT